MPGIKQDQGKAPLSLIDPDFIEMVARILDAGEQKYGKSNWRLGLHYSRVIDAARRHLAAMERGEDIDPDSGFPHAGHVTCNMLFLDYYRRKEMGTEWDDRPFADRNMNKPVDPVKFLQHRIVEWADRVYPDRTAHGALVKLVLEEIPELLHGGLHDPLEYADILILVLDIASLHGFDAIRAAHQKMDINERRRWTVDSDTGLMRHVEEKDDD
jgi:hypothetical protein